jgi:hypothetical protein
MARAKSCERFMALHWARILISNIPGFRIPSKVGAKWTKESNKTVKATKEEGANSGSREEKIGTMWMELLNIGIKNSNPIEILCFVIRSSGTPIGHKFSRTITVIFSTYRQPRA